MRRETRIAGVVLLVAAGALLLVGTFSGRAQETIAFDPAKVEIRQDGQQWLIVSEGVTVRSLYSEKAARSVLDAIRFYGLDCRVVMGSLEYFLVKGGPPAGAMKDEDSFAINPDNVKAARIQNPAQSEKGGAGGASWKVVDGDHYLLDFADNEELARQAAETIRKFRFTRVCYTADRGMTYFRVDGQPAAALPADVAPPAVPGGKSLLTVRVIEGLDTPARDPVVTVRALAEGAAPDAKSANPVSFALDPGTYQVTARVGSAGDVPPRRVVLKAGEPRELVIRTATGTLELRFTAGGKPMRSIGVVQLRAGDRIVGALSETTAKFQAMEGPYTLRVGLGSGQQTDVEGITIEAGKTGSQTIDVSCAVVSVSVRGGAYGQGKRPYIEVDAGGKMVGALMELPSRFQLMAGRYSIFVVEDGKKLGLKWIEVRAGEDQEVVLDVTAANEEPPKAEPRP